MILRYLAAALLIGAGVALQFVPLYRARLAPLIARRPWLRIIEWRLVQIAAGFGLVALGIDCLR
ncbi:MAG: hypothetical protein H6977_16175 [Gammaproteobacteria bacterium]|nr:hypothetical protein [Gammaproteobacteria bacterium]MCP5201541.1 hypothetical protein [Gammaproteobacteria bacterium]